MIKPSHISKTLIFTFLVSTGTCSGQTGWTAPAVVATTAGTSATLLTAPALAESSSGKLALMWHGHWGETTDTGTLVLPIRRHSDVYASFVDNIQASWSTARCLSDPSIINAQGQVTAGHGDNFLFSWTSGDPISHFRLHTASTSDGEDITTRTWEQDTQTTDPGYFFPQIVVSGDYQVLIRDFSYTPYWQSQRRPGISILEEDATDWRFVYQSQPYSNSLSTPYRLCSNMEVQGPDLMASLAVTYFNVVNRYGIRLLTSNNHGLNWKSTILETTAPEIKAIDPMVASDGNGTWLLFWTSEVSGNQESRQLQVQVSTDTGLTWSEPKVILDSPWGVASAAADDNNQWVVTLKGSPGEPVKYLHSGDSGATWIAQDTPIPGSIIGIPDPQIVYLKSTGRWAIVWADQDQIKMSTMAWGQSTVNDWKWY